MTTVYSGTYEACVAFIEREEKEDQTRNFDIALSEISETLCYVMELNGWDMYEGTF